MAYNFDKIARTYDRLNRLMTLGLDRCWRKRAVRGLQGNVLDVACGTGDMCVELLKRGCTVTGVDISEEMLSIARHKLAHSSVSRRTIHTPSPTVPVGTPPNLGGEPESKTASTRSPSKLEGVAVRPGACVQDEADQKVAKGVCLRVANAETLPFPDASFDAVTCAFGVRNFVHLEQGLGEMLRVLKPGGRMVILELATPDSAIIRPFYNLYTKLIIPWLGSRIAGNRDAYTYLPDSIARFPKGEAFLRVMGDTVAENATERKLTFGVCRMYVINKEAARC